MFFSIKISLIRISKKEYDSLISLIAELRAEIALLREENKLLKNGKNSNTSSTPPSHDLSRSNSKSLRISSGKKSGGQKGHEGMTLQMTANPDKIIEYRPSVCIHCGETLAIEVSKLESRKQEIIIPPIIPLNSSSTNIKPLPAIISNNSFSIKRFYNSILSNIILYTYIFYYF